MNNSFEHRNLKGIGISRSSWGLWVGISGALAWTSDFWNPPFSFLQFQLPRGQKRCLWDFCVWMRLACQTSSITELKKPFLRERFFQFCWCYYKNIHYTISVMEIEHPLWMRGRTAQPWGNYWNNRNSIMDVDHQ